MKYTIFLYRSKYKTLSCNNIFLLRAKLAADDDKFDKNAIMSQSFAFGITLISYNIIYYYWNVRGFKLSFARARIGRFQYFIILLSLSDRRRQTRGGGYYFILYILLRASEIFIYIFIGG